MPRVSTSPFERISSRVDLVDTDECILWPGSTIRGTYGTISASPPFTDKKKPLLVHRVVYENLVRPLEDTEVIDHLCRVQRCCNPRHLEAVTTRENIRRGLKFVGGMRQSCPSGHSYPESARYLRKGAYCGVCYPNHGGAEVRYG
jgi:hypothetical protein